MEFLEFNTRKTKIMQKKMIPRQNHEHHEILRIPHQNKENHETNNYCTTESRKL